MEAARISRLLVALVKSLVQRLNELATTTRRWDNVLHIQERYSPIDGKLFQMRLLDQTFNRGH